MVGPNNAHVAQLNGIHFAMEFLTKNQKRLLMTGAGKLESNWDGQHISAEGKDVIVIGVSRRVCSSGSARLLVTSSANRPILIPEGNWLGAVHSLPNIVKPCTAPLMKPTHWTAHI